MSSKKQRPFTAAERAEVHRLCFAGRSGCLPTGGAERCAVLMKISPDEYREIGQKARAEADRAYAPAMIDTVVESAPTIVHPPYCDYCNDTLKVADGTGQTHRCDHCKP